MQLCGFESAQMMKEGLLLVELGLFLFSLSLLSIFFTKLLHSWLSSFIYTHTK